jgi:hypothetical protein
MATRSVTGAVTRHSLPFVGVADDLEILALIERGLGGDAHRARRVALASAVPPSSTNATPCAPDARPRRPRARR